VRSAHLKVKRTRGLASKSLWRAKLAELRRPPLKPPKVVEIRGRRFTPDPLDRGIFPKCHGHPLDISSKKRLKREKAPPRATVRVEPRLLNGDYNNPVTGKWKKVESRCGTTGVPFKGPLTFQAVRGMFNMSVMLNSLYWICDSVKSKSDLSLAKREVSITRRFLQKHNGASRGSFGEGILRQCSIKLRSAEFEQRSAEYRFNLSPLVGEASALHSWFP